jgi:Type VI secretion system VasI, EvfG, VC_A0118
MRPRAPHAIILVLALTQAAAGQPAVDPVARLKSCSQLEAAARAACVDALLRELSTPTPRQVTPPSQPNWLISETTSPVDYVPQITAVLASQAASQDAPSSLSIRCRAGRTELLLNTNGSWPSIRTDELRVAYRIDDAPAIEQRWIASPTGGSAYFRGDVVPFLLSLPTNARLSLRVTHGRGTSQEAVFHLQGLQEVRQRLARACRWSSG